jgi:hypothetical protein
MEKFTQLNLKGENPAPKQTKPGKKGKIAAIAASAAGGLLLSAALLQTSACSNEKDKPVIVNPSTQISSSPQSATPAVTPAEVKPSSKPAVKKQVRKKSSSVTYKSPDYGVSFRYPRGYILKTGDEPHLDLAGMGPVETNFVQPGGVTVAAVEMPRGSYPGSEASSAYFSASVHADLTAQQCGQFAFALPAAADEAPVEPVKVQVGALQYDELEDAMKQSNARYYHVYQNGACWEFSLAMGTAPDSDSKGGSFTRVNPADVFGKLEKILASVKIDSEPTAATSAAPAANKTTEPASAAIQESLPPATPNR